MKRSPLSGFTLIELLIVVAIIAILAAIAVPNFLEAQTRAKVGRAKADLRTIATALESYRVDWPQYPPTPFVSGDISVLEVVPDPLSTPIAYITTADLIDPFVKSEVGSFQVLSSAGTILNWTPETSGEYALDPKSPNAGRRYYYRNHRDNRRSSGLQDAFLRFTVPSLGDWILTSYGPNRVRDRILGSGNPGDPIPFDRFIPYDPTNGTVSEGDVIRTQREPDGTLNG